MTPLGNDFGCCISCRIRRLCQAFFKTSACRGRKKLGKSETTRGVMSSGARPLIPVIQVLFYPPYGSQHVLLPAVSSDGLSVFWIHDLELARLRPVLPVQYRPKALDLRFAFWATRDGVVGTRAAIRCVHLMVYREPESLSSQLLFLVYLSLLPSVPNPLETATSVVAAFRGGRLTRVPPPPPPLSSFRHSLHAGWPKREHKTRDRCPSEPRA